MGSQRSAGLLLYRLAGDVGKSLGVQVLIGHMGGPLWARKDEGAWTIPKGEYGEDEQPFDAARREFTEELGLPAPDGAALDLGEVRQSGGKTVRAWAVEAELDPAEVVPGTFTMTWPPRSGRLAEFPELDRVAWVAPEDAGRLLVTAQREFVARLLGTLHL